jgi:hypothetical protein
MAKHRTHSIEFKRQVVQEFLFVQSTARSCHQSREFCTGFDDLHRLLILAKLLSDQENRAPGWRSWTISPPLRSVPFRILPPSCPVKT